VIPPGYLTWRDIAGGSWQVRADSLAGMASVPARDLLSGRGHRDCDGSGSGRGGIVRFDLAGRQAVGNRSLRGGFFGPMLGGLFWGAERAVRPIELAHNLRQAGVLTPEVLAAGWRSLFGPLHAHALITEAIPGGMNLLEELRRQPSGTDPGLLSAAARAIRSMHDAGFLHADLNLANLVVEHQPSGLRVHIIDLDRGRFVSPMTPSLRAGNLARLLRSHEKWIARDRPLDRHEAIGFLRQYCGSDENLLRYLLEKLRRYRTGLGPRRLFWRWKRTGS
jgi:tRNA A-37 threonylcarbamoyl transferase component Bud32